ncbi:type II secretion system protein GspD [bacterium]|nr:type II secretion system protein GspD [bacterium]MBR1776523.1 type II secretion system protein GspD [bacterium]
MKYSNMQRVLSAALLLAFTIPATCMSVDAYGDYNSYGSSSYSDGMTLNASAILTDKNDRITLSLRDSDTKQVIRMFADKVGKNVIFHSSVNGKVTLDLVDMPINDAFNLVLQVAGLKYYVQNNTLIVLAKDSADNANFAKQEMMLFPVNYITAQKIADFLNKNVFTDGAQTATVNAPTNEVIVFGMPSSKPIVQKVIDQLDREPLSRTFAVNHTTPAEMADMICNMLLPSRGATTGGGGKGDDTYAPPTPGVMGGAAGIVTGGAANSMGSGTEMKLGEGTIACTVSQNAQGSGAGAATGFDLQNLAVSYYPQRGTILVMGGSEAQLKMIENFIKANDIKQQQAYLEMSIVELTEEGSKEFENNWQIQSNAWGFKFAGGQFSGGRPGGHGQAYQDYTYRGWSYTDEKGNPIAYNQPGTDGSSTRVFPTYQEVTGKLPFHMKNSYISWTMNYLIENRKARILANPKLIITNGQESVIDLTQDYVEKVTSEFLSAAGTSTVGIGAVQKTYTIGEDKGIKIALTPFISPDGYVTMNIKPEYAVEAGQVIAPGQSGQNELQATLLSRRNLDLKNLRVKDGETLVIGGLIQEVEQKNVRKIPVLGDLPLIGAAFRSTSTSKGKSELVLMITPRIIDDGDGAVADSL